VVKSCLPLSRVRSLSRMYFGRYFLQHGLVLDEVTCIAVEKSPSHSSTGQCGCTILRNVSKKSALYSSWARAISTSFSFSADEARSLRTSPTGR
jgi:hypothetical protein